MVLTGCDSAAREPAPASPVDTPAATGTAERRPALGLFTTLPILWGEGGSIAELLDAPRDPARSVLERRWQLVPLDTLEEGALAGLSQLALVQPRVLAPAENVALDTWVRAGGRLVLFADPLLTRHSRFPVGDKRRAQDVALLSPILARWGLALAESEEERAHPASILGTVVTVDHPGRLALAAHDAPAACRIEDEGLVARCTIGKGAATIVADAALFDLAGDAESDRALDQVVAAALGA